jgi:hypothetical protein
MEYVALMADYFRSLSRQNGGGKAEVAANTEPDYLLTRFWRLIEGFQPRPYQWRLL